MKTNKSENYVAMFAAKGQELTQECLERRRARENHLNNQQSLIEDE
jgi:hypothetical protein